ncbi:MAG: HAMP domain-containing histidine kinase [Lachnospiraceae bacterium]|nr:HAMP domain-containing histidine kinase [Lachnospiraceae bacterium]
MDTKLTGSKKFSFAAAGVIVIICAIVFMAFYPSLEKRAAGYSSVALRDEDMLVQFYQANLVLNKSVMEKSRQEHVKFADLYLEIEEEDLSVDELTRGNLDFLENQTQKEVEDFLESRLEWLLETWKNGVVDGLAKSMDYCVIDHNTGEVLKNTGRSIEKLYEDKSFKNEEAPYEYYVMMTYDESGNLSRIAVRDEEPDELLKNLQSVMDGERLKYRFKSQIEYELGANTEIYLADEKKKLSYSISDGPKNMTFIYGLTNSQKDNIRVIYSNQYSGYVMISGYQWENKASAYLSVGAEQIYQNMLLALAIAALLITRSKRYCLHRLKGVKLHLEITLFSMMCMMFGTVWAVVDLICYTNSSFFPDAYGRYFPFLPEQFYYVVTIMVNMVVLTLIFGFWYYLVTTLGEVFVVGPKEFLNERSLLVRVLFWLRNGVRRKKDRFKEEILHVDLGEKAEKTIRKLVILNFLILGTICSIWIFGWAVLVVYSVILYFLLKKYVEKIQEQYRKLLEATGSIADGNLQTKFGDDWGVFESYKEELSKIQNGFRAAVDEEVKSQKMKTELITNVSHDLKTPLTAITTYIELLETENLSDEQRKEYLGVLKKKAERLKFLIEDLFEVSKASSGNIVLNPVDVDICNLMRQVYLEYEDRVEESGLIFRFCMPEEKVILQLDSQMTYRVFENLYTNIIKYAMPRTRVYVNAEKTEKGISIELKNMSAVELNVPPESLTERFVRGDSARNTEGSGLGLAIATSFVELQGGKLKVEIDGDLFKVQICW